MQRDEATKRLAEQALAHVNPNRVDAAYMRSDLFELRRELMEAWSGYLSQQAFTVARHVPALDRSECHWIGRSVGRWTWEQVTEEWWSEQQARRSLASGASRRAAAERGGAGGAGGARLAHSGSRGYAIMEETALELGLLFRTLAPMRDRVNIRAVVEGFETMQHEEIAYRAGNGNAP